jgi:hypothetical protein
MLLLRSACAVPELLSNDGTCSPAQAVAGIIFNVIPCLERHNCVPARVKRFAPAVPACVAPCRYLRSSFVLSYLVHSIDAVRVCDQRYSGKVVQTPEVVRVYLGSFWEAPLKLEDNR